MEYEFKQSPFSPMNFPDNVSGNEKFNRIGERTIYVPTTSNGPWFEGGFPVLKPTALVDQDGKKIRDMKAGEKVWFTYPAKLFKGSELGKMPASFTYAAINTQPGGSSEGFVTIASVTKPSPKSTGRVAQGAAAQNHVAERAVEMLRAAGHTPDESGIKIAKVGSAAPDIIIPYDGKTVQFEVKGTSNLGAPITLFDKSVSRSKPVPAIVDEFAIAFIDAMELKIDRSFISLIDYYREKNPEIGLAGDPGTIKSGKLPKELITVDSRVLEFAYNQLIDHFREGKDDYLAIVDRGDNQVLIYSVNDENNPLEAPVLPKLKWFGLITYGGASGASTRVGLKVRF